MATSASARLLNLIGQIRARAMMPEYLGENAVKDAVPA
jgi:hypothetical protein